MKICPGHEIITDAFGISRLKFKATVTVNDNYIVEMCFIADVDTLSYPCN